MSLAFNLKNVLLILNVFTIITQKLPLINNCVNNVEIMKTSMLFCLYKKNCISNLIFVFVCVGNKN